MKLLCAELKAFAVIKKGRRGSANRKAGDFEVVGRADRAFSSIQAKTSAQTLRHC